MRRLLLSLALVFLAAIAHAEPFEIKDGDRVLFLGDTLLEREGTYGYLETRMAEQFPDRKFTVRNLAFSADTPLGWSRASFDPAAKGFERLKEQLALVKPTVVFLGYGMAASLQEMTDRSQDWTLNRDPARYGAEPMSAARFKKELAQCMDAIVAVGDDKVTGGQGDKVKDAPVTPSPGHPVTPSSSPVRFVLLSPIRHEDLRNPDPENPKRARPGLPDPTEHNKLIEQYSKSIEELAKERGATFVDLSQIPFFPHDEPPKTLNGIHLEEGGYALLTDLVSNKLDWSLPEPWKTKVERGGDTGNMEHDAYRNRIQAAIIRKNELFFHRWRPANETYLFGFRKREQGQNAVEIPKFDPLIEAAEAEIERLKKDPSATPAPVAAAPQPAPFVSQPHPSFTLADGLEISLWAENPLLAKPTQMNWDAQGRLWVACSAMYPQIAPGQTAFDKILVLEDTNGDGKAEKSTVFADGLLIPTGVVPVLTPEGHWACYVGQSTELLYFEDTDGDGKADRKRIVFGGFGTEDTHHIVHTLRWGPDGRLYFSQSVYIHTHMETPWGVVRVNSGGTFAYDPRTERVEVVQKGLWNTWGHAWDKWGQSFHTDGAGSTGLSWAFPGATFAPSEGARRTMASISPGSYPKFAGLEFIYSPHFPADWQGTAVTCDFRAHKIVQFKISDLGSQNSDSGGNEAARKDGDKAGANQKFEPKSGYITEQLPVLVQTSDATFRPIDVKLGPDGALYIADWSNPIINHGEVDFRDPRRDHEQGRIWRLSMKGGAAVKWESFTRWEGEGTHEKLLVATTSTNLWHREQANQFFIQNLESTRTAASARATLDAALKETTPTFKLLRAVVLNRTMPARTPDSAPVGILLSSIYRHASAAVVGYFDPVKSKEAEKAMAKLRQKGLGEVESVKKVQELKGRIDALIGNLKIEPAKEIRIKREIQSVLNEFNEGMGINDEMTRVLAHSANFLATNRNPRVRVMAMRTFARIPTAESASLILDAAINSPKDDPYYEFAAWLSINDLAEVWTKAVLAGAWKPEGREKQLEFALNAIEPALAGQVLSQFVSTGRAPLDGSGPWIELIGNTGGPGELRLLLDGLLAATTPDGENPKPLADSRYRFKTPGANARAAAALVAAARRGVKPTGVPIGDWRFFFYAPEEALPDIIRLAGLWKENVSNAIRPHIHSEADPKLLDACFETLRVLGTPGAAEDVAAYLGVNLDGKADETFVQSASGKANPALRRRALAAFAALRPGEALKQLRPVLQDTPERDQPQLWRDLFASAPFLQGFTQKIPEGLPPASYISALRVAREMGRKGQSLANKLAPQVGEKAPDVAPADYNDLAARAKKDGDPVAGEAMYRRMASACTTCHAIGGAGGKLGPDMTSIGASAPADYIIESILNPAAKVKEGYHAFSFTMKDGSEAIGIPSRETPQEQFIRTIAGEQGLPKANIVSKKIAEGGASLMPAGLTAAWSDRERLNLYAFLMELGRPGPFDASKNNVARVWQLSESDAKSGLLPPATTNTTPIPAYTLVDGRLTKDLLAEKITVLSPKSATVLLTARFQAATAGKATLNLTGIRKAWLDGQGLAIASEPSPSIELTAGEHTFTVEVDAKSPPDVVRLESPAASFLGD